MHQRIALLIGLTLAGASPAKEITLRNPSFEEAATVDATMPGWRASQHSGEDSYEFTTVGDVFAKGKRSFRLTRLKEQVYGSLDQIIPAASLAGQTVEYRFQLRSEDVGPNGFCPYINLTASSGDVLEQVRGDIITGTINKWKTIKIRMTIPKDAHGVALGMLLLDAGTVWVDDVSLRTVEAAADKAPTGKDPQPAKP